jgi:predicted transcriptional regulator
MRKKKLPMGGLLDAVMNTLWDDGGWMTPGEVHAGLQGDRPLAQTTVTTVLVRLWEKDRLERRPHGRTHQYHPTMSREEWAAARITDVLVAGGDRKAALTHFVDALDAEDRIELQRMLGEKPKP